MIILGINEGHNCSACLLIDGEIKSAVSEERFSRIKNDCGYPKLSIEYCLKQANISGKDIDFVAVSTKELEPVATKMNRVSKYKISDYVDENYEYWKPKLYEGKDIDYYEFLKNHELMNNKSYYDFSFLDIAKNYSERISMFNEERVRNIMNHLGLSEDKIIFLDHHLCHAYQSYYSSDLRDDVLIITADGWGDGANASINIGDNDSVEFIKKTPNNNLARLYSWATLLLGMKPHEHEYKVMGLAPYSKDYLKKKPFEIYSNTLVVEGDDFKWNFKPKDMYFYFKSKLEGCRFDGIAGGLQDFTELRMKEWVSNLCEKYNKRKVVYSGGLALNVKANKRIMELPEVDNLFVPFASGDEGLAIGGAYLLASRLGIKDIKPVNAYLGIEYSREDILKAINNKKARERFCVKENVTIKEVAKYLAEGKVIARCFGRMEFGARALGNRSILANPSKFEMIEIINNKIKFRDFWMPFTPTILDYREKDYIINPKNISSKFMTITFDSTELAKKELKSAIHPNDKTIRPQILSKEDNPEYYYLIQEFEKITDIGALLNTSFNLHGEPIVCSPEDAIHTFEESGLDMLYMEDILISREKT